MLGLSTELFWALVVLRVSALHGGPSGIMYWQPDVRRFPNYKSKRGQECLFSSHLCQRFGLDGNHCGFSPIGLGQVQIFSLLWPFTFFLLMLLHITLLLPSLVHLTISFRIGFKSSILPTLLKEVDPKKFYCDLALSPSTFWLTANPVIGRDI
jgi:hypothetical protein